MHVVIRTNMRAMLGLSLLPGLLMAGEPASDQAAAPVPGWKRQEVDLRIGAGKRVRAVYAPADRPVPFHGTYRRPLPARHFAGPAAAGAQVGVINSPPLDGFVPYITVVATDEKDLDTYSSTPWDSLVGSPFVSDPALSYAVGLYDTGASSSVIGYASANQMGLYAANQLTQNTITVTGVTGSVDCYTSKPLGLFVDGLQAVDPQSLLLSTDAMRGQSNYCALVGPEPAAGAPDLATAIGAPMAAYFHAAFRNDQPVTRVIDGQVCTGPSIRLYENASDPAIPAYPNWIDLQYLPDDTPVMYFPCISILFECPDDNQPWIPSLIGGGNLAQSLFFISQSIGLDLTDTGHSRTFYKFIIDTGAQVTVIGSTVVARLALNPSQPDFQVDIQGVDGQTVIRPGFYLDTMDIPGVGAWLSYTHVPVVYLDVASPECLTCKLDGIIGMNLLDKYNFVVHGGLYEGTAPTLAFERIAIFGDSDGDFDVDQDDVLQFEACAAGPNITPANPDCLFFDEDGDNDVDQSDFGALQACYSGAGIDADPKCHPAP
jgi:hypothetical protein